MSETSPVGRSNELHPMDHVDVDGSTTNGTVGLFQVFDEFSANEITPAQASSDGWHYGAVWGARPGMTPSWSASNTGITSIYYMLQETDASSVAWGSIGHTLSWWQENHPSWVLYDCTSAGTPTKTPAYIAGMPYNVPLDIHNPDVVAYQVELAGDYAISQGYTGIGFDEVLFVNITGSGVPGGDYGCGIYEGSTFVKRYSGFRDPNWTEDTVAWVKTARSILRTDSALENLKLVVNHPAGSATNAMEQAILDNVDADIDEPGFSDYGNYKLEAARNYVSTTLAWMAYAQSVGAVPLIVDKFDQTAPVTSLQLEYSIATYLLGDTSSSRLFVGNANSYGAEQYHDEYSTDFGAPCGAYYGGASYDPNNPNIYYRRFTNAVVVVNAGSLPRGAENAYPPSGHTYTDLEKRPVTSTNPLVIDSNDAYVLLTKNACH